MNPSSTRSGSASPWTESKDPGTLCGPSSEAGTAAVSVACVGLSRSNLIRELGTSVLASVSGGSGVTCLRLVPNGENLN